MLNFMAHWQIYLAPESPWWLVRREQPEAALKALDRLSMNTVNNDETLAFMFHTIKIEQELKLGASFMDCFKGPDRRRTEIEVFVRIADALATFGLVSGTFFFENA